MNCQRKHFIVKILTRNASFVVSFAQQLHYCKKEITRDLYFYPEMFAATHVNQQRKYYISRDCLWGVNVTSSLLKTYDCLSL